MPKPRAQAPSRSPAATSLHVAVIGAGMAGVACARTLVQAGHHVTLLDAQPQVGGRTLTRSTEFGGFDGGAQYFTVRDKRFERALGTVKQMIQPWKTQTVRVLDAMGQVMASAPDSGETHWVATPGMGSLVAQWAAPLATGTLDAAVHLDTQVQRIERDALHPRQWQLRASSAGGAQGVLGGFDRVVLAVPPAAAQTLLQASQLAPKLQTSLSTVSVAPCWTLMLAFPQAAGVKPFGPHWNAARSDHHRIRWLARESSKPGRNPLERWTVQASPGWSAEHINDTPQRVQAKLLKGFAEITGIRAEPGFTEVQCWPQAQTQSPLGKPYALEAKLGIGLCGDWCLGYRLEDAFVSGLELALALIEDR